MGENIKKSVFINKKKTTINGNIGMIFSADDVTREEKVILRSYLNTTSNIAGCQAIRRKIGQLCFGMRVVYGETIFVTVSPNRRHSSMILKMSRCRKNDTSLTGQGPVVDARAKFSNKNAPKVFANSSYADDEKGCSVTKEIPLPELWIRQACNAQDPLASCHHYLFFMMVVLPASFGIRLCFACPDCNVDSCHAYTKQYMYTNKSCSDYLGNNSKLMGGHAGMATAMCFATEYQGEATPHGHGFISLANMYQHHTLEEIGCIIEKNAKGISPEDMLKRITGLCEHLQREDHFDHEQHEKHIEELEQAFHKNNSGPAENVYLSVRPQKLFDNSAHPSLWDDKANQSTLHEEVNIDSKAYQRTFENDAQFIFSRVQHHWHAKDSKGNRIPLAYCRLRKNSKSFTCKSGFPKKVIKHSNGKLKTEKWRVRIVCQGVANEMELKTSGRRNALGSILGRRRCHWLSGTSPLLAVLSRSNTNVQTNYRVPITSYTHDADCKSVNVSKC